MTTTEIRDALRAVEQAVDVPPVDRVDFQARVRAERRRRTAGRALIGVAAAAALVAGGVTARAVLDDPDRTPVADVPVQPDEVLTETVFLVLDHRLTALDPDGTQHDLGQPGEAVVGTTSELLVAVDDESRVVMRRTEPPFREVASPVAGAVQSVALSGDGRYLAWLDLDDEVHRYDLVADREDVTFDVGTDGYVAAVGERGVLAFTDGALVLRDANGSIPIPVQNDGFSYSSDLARDLVTVNDGDGRSQLYDVSSGTARLVETFEGEAAIGPFAERVAVIVPEARDRARVEVWDGGTRLPVTGLGDVIPTFVRWAGETTLLVDGEQAGLFACDIDLRCARLPVSGDVRITE